jgi:hypothetical protein
MRRDCCSSVDVIPSYTLDNLCALAVQLISIAGVGLLLAVFQTGAGVGFEHAMLGAEVTAAEAAVSDNALGLFLALLKGASGLARRHCRLVSVARRERGG